MEPKKNTNLIILVQFYNVLSSKAVAAAKSVGNKSSI